MNALILSEYRKLGTLRSTWYALAAAPVFSAAVAAAGVHLLRGADDVVVTEVARTVAEPLWLFVSVIAILASAGEFQHGTVLTTLLSTPRRTAVLGAKAVVIAAYGAVLTTVGMGSAVAAGLVTAQVEGVGSRAGDPAGWAGLAGAVSVGALFGMLSSALGMLTRSTALALTTLLLWRFVAEGILPVVLRRPGISDWTPSGAANTLAGPVDRAVVAAGGGLLLVGYVAAVAAAAAWTFCRRDPA